MKLMEDLPLFYRLQGYFKAHQHDFSSEHETAIYRSVISSKTPKEAARKIYKMKGGRLNDINKNDSVSIIENLLREMRWRD